MFMECHVPDSIKRGCACATSTTSYNVPNGELWFDKFSQPCNRNQCPLTTTSTVTATSTTSTSTTSTTATTSTATDTANPVEPKWVAHGNYVYRHFYKEEDRQSGHVNADNACQVSYPGARLLWIESDEEEQFIQSSFFWDNTDGGDDWVLIGCNDVDQEGDFVWMNNGESCNKSGKYSKWSDGEPNDFEQRNEDCTVIASSNGMGWFDVECDKRTRSFMCKGPLHDKASDVPFDTPPSTASSAVKARYVKLINPERNEGISLTEVQLFSEAAEGPEARLVPQSTNQSSISYERPASKCFDDVTECLAADAARDKGKDACVCATDDETNAWIQADYGKAVDVAKIVVTNRRKQASIANCIILLCNEQACGDGSVVWAGMFSSVKHTYTFYIHNASNVRTTTSTTTAKNKVAGSNDGGGSAATPPAAAAEQGGAGESSDTGDGGDSGAIGAPESGASLDENGDKTPEATSPSSSSPLPMIVGIVLGSLVVIVLLVFVCKKCSEHKKRAKLQMQGGMNGPPITTNQAYEHNNVAAAAAAAGAGIPDDNNTYDMAPPGQRSAALNSRRTGANGSIPDDNNTYDMAPPGQRSVTANIRNHAAGASNNTPTVQLTPNAFYDGSADVMPRNATLILNRGTSSSASASSQDQYAAIADGIADGRSGPPEGTVVYNAGVGGDGGGGPMYATPTSAITPTYAVYAGSSINGGGGGDVYATVNKDAGVRPRSNSLFSLSGVAQRDRSGTLQLTAAQQGVVYTVPMEEEGEEGANSSNI